MRNSRTFKLLVVLLLGTLVTALALAAPRANPRRGKVFFKKQCRVCHDGTTGQNELQPITKTMDQWSREFAKNGPVSSCLPRVKEKTGADLTTQDLLDIQSYLVQHAADSDHPATCGKQ